MVPRPGTTFVVGLLRAGVAVVDHVAVDDRRALIDLGGRDVGALSARRSPNVCSLCATPLYAHGPVGVPRRLM